MGLIAFFRGMSPNTPTDARAKEMRDAVLQLIPQLQLDFTRRMYGDDVYSGYKLLRDFYKGKQWSFFKEEGGTTRTYNYCFTIVENMTAFLTNEPPQMSAQLENQGDPLERIMAEGRTKLLTAVHRGNSLSLVFQRAARTASINGDAYIFGSIPTFVVDDKGNKHLDDIRYWNVERPETIRPIWKDDSYTEMAGFVKYYRLEVETAKRLFAEEIKAANVRVQEDQDIDNLTGDPVPTQVKMMTIKEYWTEDEYLLMFGNDSQIVHYVKHDWGFVPLQYIPNIHLPGEPRGTSDLENEMDAQQEYNERASDLADIIKEIARPTYWGKDLDNLTEVRSGQTVIYQVGDDGVIEAMPKSGATAPLETYLNDRKNDIIGLSGMNQVLYPGSQVLQATGRALSVIMQGVNNKVSLRKEWWAEAFRKLNHSIFFHIQEWVPGGKELINNHFGSDVFISSVLLRSVTDEINKFNAKLQSLTTTQTNVGISNPSEEQKLMKEELEDDVLATEIAKQPGLLHQILAERAAAAQPQVPEVAGGGGAPIANEANNAPGGNPIPAPGAGSPVSPQAAVAAAATRNGAARQVPKR